MSRRPLGAEIAVAILRANGAGVKRRRRRREHRVDGVFAVFALRNHLLLFKNSDINQ
jgi:hypothetical protein